MVEVIQLHPYKQSYPFGLQKESECTYVQLIKQLTSQTQLMTYKQNLALFKSLESDLVIPLDSYVKENNTLQLYYEYEPLSIKHYIEERLMMMAEDQVRDKFLTKIITSINVAIQDVITLMMSRKIMALLSIDNMAIGKGEKIKFFIQPDFQYVDKPTPNQLTQYFNTQKKKLQIQLEQFLQHIFSFTNTKPKDHGKANFVIQGTKLVFVNQQQTNRQSSMSGVSVLPTTSPGNVTNASSIIGSNTSGNTGNATTVHQVKHQIKLPAYMLKQPKQLKEIPEQLNVNNSSKQKFDIKNILDEKKLQKNQPHFPSKEHSAKPHAQQSTLDRSPTKNSFTEATEESNKNNEKDVKNYFENNDDFNKDASFYPEEFIKEDSIAEFEGYEDQLEKQLQDLKKKKYQAEQLANTSKNRLSMVPNTPINPQLGDQKMSKSPSPQQGQSTKPNKNPNQFPQNVLNSSDSRQNDTSQEQQKQKKKYKVTITTSHLVDVDDQNADLRTIEQELIEDIKKGAIKHNPQGTGNGNNKQQQPANTPHLKGNNEKQGINSPNLPAHLLKGHSQIPQNSYDSYSSHQAPTTHKQTSSNSLTQEHPTQQRQFSKQQHPHMSSQTSTYSSQVSQNKEQSQQYNSGTFNHGGNTTTSNQQAPDIKKIIEKIKNNSQNHQFITSTSMTQGGNLSSQNPAVVKPPSHQHPEPTYQGQRVAQQQETRPHSQLSSQSPVNNNVSQNSEKKEQEKEYYDKIQKAKMKAEEIMKLVKERKGQ